MMQLLIAAPGSGSGKTVVVCALLRALQRRGLAPCAFKCGPDYIDPMFHRAALGVDSANLDLFLSDAGAVRALYTRGCQGRRAAVCEGVMGFYDGVGGTAAASSWQLADVLGLPVLLVLRPQGDGASLVDAVRGLAAFRRPNHLAGILLNDCPPALAAALAPALERGTGLPVLGFLPPLAQAAIPSRHLGLLTADEISDLNARLDALADALEQNADLPRLLALCERPAPAAPAMPALPPVRARIAVARDEAFCFCYPETLAALRAAGAQPVFFSPLRDAALPPDIGGLYLPGGYPELYAAALAANAPMRRSIAAVRAGLPTVAECGGYLYLCQSLEGRPMAGVLPGTAARRSRPVRFGYAQLTANADGLLLRRGESVPVHSFHYWDSDVRGEAFALEKPVSGRAWTEGFASPTLYAAFPHLYFAGHPRLAARFARAAEEFAHGHPHPAP